MNKKYWFVLYLIFSTFGSLFGTEINLISPDDLQNKDYLYKTWERFNKNKKYLENPNNWKQNRDFMDIGVPKVMAIDLAILLAAGEIKHRKIFLPSVPNKKNIFLCGRL